MKNLIGSLAVALGILATGLYAQTVQESLSLIESVQPMAADNAPVIGTFYSAQHAPGTANAWPPLPGNIYGLPIWDLGSNVFLLSDEEFDYSAPMTMSRSSMGMMAMDVPNPGGGGSGSGTNQPGFNFVAPDYGSNLWLQITGITNNTANLILSNTIADVEYQILGISDLTTSNWISQGFLLGSEITNWTATTADASDFPNHFYKALSWQDSDGNGLPDWWQLKYFGTLGIDPYADPDGDGWNNLQEFQNGTNPNSWNVPPAPNGLTVIFNSLNGTATISWLASPGAVTGYTLQTPNGTYTLSASTFSFLDTNLPGFDPGEAFYSGATIDGEYTLLADYAGGNSAGSSAPLEPDALPFYPPAINFVAGPQGMAYLAVATLPAGVQSVRLSRYDDYAEFYYGDYSFDTNYDFPIDAFTNGFCLLPSFIATPPDDSYGYSDYYWWVQLVYSNGGVSKAESPSAGFPYYGFQPLLEESFSTYPMPPYWDGRQQLKQNLIFLLRAATADYPFYFDDNYGSYGIRYTNLSSYVYSGFYTFDLPGYWDSSEAFDPLELFSHNAHYRNFALDASRLDAYGRLTGISSFNNDSYSIVLNEPAAYQFSVPTASGTTISSLLDTNATRWLASYPFGAPYSYLSEIGMTNDNSTYRMAGNARNYFGLSFLSAKLADENGIHLLSAGGSVTPAGSFEYCYPETAQPQFQTVEYDFYHPLYYGDQETNALPGVSGFVPTNTGSLLLTSVGNPNFAVAGYAKLAVTNAYSGVYAYLGQYFDKAYKVTNGVVTSTETGILSPYGNFFATEPGQVALVTMPDIDTGERGTGYVYCISLNVDKNHDGNMDLSFAGDDATSANSPFVFWVNNNYDRGHTVDGSDFEQDDLGPVDIAKGHLVPDCQYTTNGLPAIPCTRDLEDYFRMWTPGIAALMQAIPTNYTVQLALSGDGQIRIFQAIEPDGGTNYLFDEVTAQAQVSNSTSLYVGLLTQDSPVILTSTNEHFIFCGAQIGNAQIDLQVLDNNGNVLADAPTYLQIKDIKQMYERYTVGDDITGTNRVPMSVATWQVDNLAYQYPQNTDTNTPYILFVHGWNMATWEKDRFAETTFKRLYWQGYQGRFGEFRWPTYYAFPFGEFSSQAINPRNFDNSEYNAWLSGIGLLNKLKDLNAKYPGNVYLMAHSHGNIVAGEALRLATNQVVNTYIAMQAAVSAHTYDTNTPMRDFSPSTPDNYANYWTNNAPCYFSASAGAGTYVNFFNTNDYALATATFSWEFNQNSKPDNASPGPAYHYSSSSGFYKIISVGNIAYLNFPTNTYEIFAYGDQSWSRALGAEAGISTFTRSLNLQTIWPLDNSTTDPSKKYGAHKWHSAEFRSDNANQWIFWNTVLGNQGFNLK